MDEQFRDSIATINEKGKRNWIYPKKPRGRYHVARSIVAFFLILFFVAAPFVKINGHQMLLFNVIERKFILFGLPFGPHDFYIFVIGFIAFVVFIILFTAIYGRLFCGWVCPQTIFMESVFRKIEYLIEGDFRQQIALDKAPMSGSKAFKKGLKHFLFYAVSFIVANLFLAYIAGTENAFAYISANPTEHTSSFIGVMGFSLLFYLIFSRFREQACVIVCPYGRLQGVLLDENSLAVSYDFVRGEPRGKLKKENDEDKGDCVDCKLCVQVCPTGIDIRNGIQLECVNCTACIDACDEVMDKIKKPRGLIRYDSLKGIKERVRFKFTGRIIAYSIVLTILLGVFGILIANRTDIDIKILRTPGMLYQDQAGGKISNLYNLNIVNKTFDELRIEIKLKEMAGEIKFIGSDMNLKPQEKNESKFMVILEKSALTKINTPVTFGVYENGKEIKTVKTSFLSHVGMTK
ncbi:MAG: cytochrome c oxidase accessory protein CcoG [Ignavibacteriaceae bacterium]